MSKLEIRNIFFDDVERLFDNSLNQVAKKAGVDAQKAWDKLEDKYEEIINGFDETLIDLYLTNNKFSLENFLSTHKKNQETIISLNSKSFKNFIIYINCCHIIYEKTYENIEEKEISENLKLCIALYGIIVRKSQQIVTLLIDGYIDASMIIWRSLYENVVACLTLLTEQSDELAKKFINHSIKNSNNKIISYKKNHKELNFKDLPKNVTDDLEREKQRVEELYGKKFIKNECGWADDLFDGNERASLRLLEIRLNLNRYRPYYLMCSEHTHLGFNSFKGYMENAGVILPRITKQDYELKHFIDPMQFTIAILHEINDLFLYEVSIPHEYNINIKFLKRISENFSKIFSETDIE